MSKLIDNAPENSPRFKHHQNPPISAGVTVPRAPETSQKTYSKADHHILAQWALDCAERVILFFERTNALDERPRNALMVGREWTRTRLLRTPALRAASLSAFAAAKDAEPHLAACFAAHACGQAVATAHVAQHAYGASYYALKALAASDDENAAQLIAREFRWQSQHLAFHLRAEVMGRIIVAQRRKGPVISIRKGRDAWS